MDAYAPSNGKFSGPELMTNLEQITRMISSMFSVDQETRETKLECRKNCMESGRKETLCTTAEVPSLYTLDSLAL